LRQFGGNISPDDIAICAVLEIEERSRKPLVVGRNPLLAAQARTAINVEVEVIRSEPRLSRCAAAILRGKRAVEVTVAVVVAYGEYVKKLFDNFD